MKKIMILNGVTRKNRNTAALIEAFTEGAKSAGNEIREFYLQGMNIHGCLGCNGFMGNLIVVFRINATAMSQWRVNFIIMDVVIGLLFVACYSYSDLFRIIFLQKLERKLMNFCSNFVIECKQEYLLSYLS